MKRHSERTRTAAEPQFRAIDRSQRFEALRPSLARLAYRMLGIVAEAEDVVQDAYLRWHEALDRTSVANDGAYLRATVTRLALDRLRSARARREVYVGPWLPEPLLEDSAPQPEEAATLADDMSFAFLVALERLSPLERAAFLLHDVLDVPFDEVATALDRSPEACRALASRAREHVRAPRERRLPPRGEMLRLRDAFASAMRDGDAGRLSELLTADVVAVTDGGGKKIAALNPIAGLDRVVRFAEGLVRKVGAGLSLVPATVNGLPGFMVLVDDAFDGVLSFEFAGDRIAALYFVSNPDKLAAASRVVTTGGNR